MIKNNSQRIYIKVIPRAKREKIEKISKQEYKIWVTVPPEKGKANQVVIKILSQYFQKPKSLIRIIGGKSSRQKIVDID